MKYLKGKTWIDWVKAIVAIDIAAVGTGLIFQQEIHILANVFGSISRIVFGILYIIVAVAIFKMVFPQLFKDLQHRVHEVTDEVHKIDDTHLASKADIPAPKETVGEIIDKAAKKIDSFVNERSREVKEEVNKVLDK